MENSDTMRALAGAAEESDARYHDGFSADAENDTGSRRKTIRKS
jgi:hypothetical protein